MRRHAARINTWTEHEDDVLRDLYPAGGISACMKALRHRTQLSIQGRAQNLGLRTRLNKKHAAQLIEADHRALNAALGGWTATPEELRL